MQKSNWKKCKLGDVATTTTTKISCSDITSNYISTENMLPDKGGIVAASLLPNSGNVSIYHKGDVLVSNIRPYFKKIWHATVDGAASNDVIVFHANEGVNSRYLYYTLADDNFFAYVMTGAKGTKMPRGDRKQILQYPVNLPSLDEQKRIAEILGSLDDKIELLQKQNKTLEDMAKALFKSWFVDFDVVRAKQKGLSKADIMREYHLTEELYDLFPSSFADSPLGPIPSGWEVKKIGELVSVVRGGSPRPIQKFLSKEGLPWLKISDATASPTKFITHIEQCIIPEGLSKTRFIKKGSLVVSNSATPGMPKFLALDTCIHDGWLFLDDYKGITKELLYYFILFNRAELVALGSGSVFTNLKTDVLKNFQIVVPTGIIQNKLNPIFAQIDEAILLHNKQIQTLTELRDTLLPRLISGKIRV